MYESVYLVTRKLRVAVPAAVARLSSQVGGLPDGYAEYVTTLGQGTYSTFIRVYMPERIAIQLPDFRARWRDDFVWDEQSSPIAKRDVLESVIVADTLNGDELIYHRGSPGAIFILPRYSDAIAEVPGGLDRAIDWACSSGVLTAPIGLRYFESEVDREKIELYATAGFEPIRKSLLARRLHTHLVTADRKERFLHLLFEPFNGSLSYFGHTRTASLEFDRDSKNAAWSQLLAALGTLGFLTAEEREQKAKKAGRRAGARSLPARDEALGAKEVVSAFMKAMRIWESRVEEAHSDWDGFQEFSRQIARGFFVRKPPTLDYSTPSCNERRANPFVKVSVKGKKARVATERRLRGDETVRVDYMLIRGTDGWRIAKVDLDAPSVVKQRF